ncbi:MAG: DUF6266 family protein [Bacteroidota bacterium]
MGKLNQGILGSVYGKVGNIVASKWKNLNTVRGYQPNIHNPQTIDQVAQRKRFATIVKLVRQLLPLINDVYAGDLPTMSAFNKVTGLNLKNAFTGTPPVFDPTLVQLCHYDGSTITNVHLDAQPGLEMKIQWDVNTVNADELGYMMTFVLFNSDTNESEVYVDAAKRADGATAIYAPYTWAGSMTTLHVLTMDYEASGGLVGKKIIKYKGGNDLASKVIP